MIDKEDIVALAERIAHEFAPERIILFGSYAYGTPTADSDVDLLVVLPFEGSHRRKAIEIKHRADVLFPLHLLARTPETICQRLEWGDFFLREIIDRGRTLHEAVGASALGPTGRVQQEVQVTNGLAANTGETRNPLTDEWLGVAERGHLARVTPYHDATVTLARRSVEAYLKAVLQEHCIASGKGHDLPALCDLLAPVDPAWADLREQVRELERVATGAGYPGSKVNKRVADAAIVTCRDVRTHARTTLGLAL